MGKVTYVVEYEDGKEPAVSGATEVLGGKLLSVGWYDYRDDFFEPADVDAVREALNEIACDGVDYECHNEIISKLELLTK